MSVGFRAVQWNRRKIIYDAILIAAVVVFIATYMTVGALRHPPADKPAWINLRISALGLCAFTMLTIILCIGPLTRLDRRFLPLLYNRRHFGVLTFFVALAHAYSVVDWFAAVGDLPSLVTELTSNPKYLQFIGFPMKALGLFALCVLFLLAATSHDFWLAFLTPRIWKALHMALYLAYGVLVMHVALGAMQEDRSGVTAALLGASFALVTGLHIAAAARESDWQWLRRYRVWQAGREGFLYPENWLQPDLRDDGDSLGDSRGDPWIKVGAPASIPDQCARVVVTPGGERIAVFRDGNQIGALTNVCAHQNGPIGEGRIINGCVTCPWHGYEYRLEDGCAPPPFTEKLATYRVRLRGGIVEVEPKALPPGTPAAIRIG